MKDDQEVIVRKFKETCCKSYLTPKGRCFTCPELQEEYDPDEEILS